MARVSNREARQIIANREEFQSHTGSLSGEYALSRYTETGVLPMPYVMELRKAIDEAGKRGNRVYVVRSYATPIGWHDGTGWVRPDVKYSVTTSKHQGLVPLGGSR